MSANSSSSSDTDTSLSLSSGLLPDENNHPKIEQNQEHEEHQSSISEHITSLNSLENDRSLLEIEINNIPDIQPDELHSLSLNSANSATKNVRSVLEEILHNDQFHSERSDRLDSNDVSLNIFDGVNLDDSSIHNYVRKLTSHSLEHESALDTKVQGLEDALAAKESIIQGLHAELESLRDMASSNPSTLSLNTTLTEYKQFQKECDAKCVNYENAVARRDTIIRELKEALQRTQQREDALCTQVAQYGKDLQAVQRELAEAGEYMKQYKCLDPATADGALDAIYVQLTAHLGPDHVDIVDSIKLELERVVEERLKQSHSVHSAAIERLREQHVKEMDDTRVYYEKKCADFMSDELISQHSKKLSDDEFASDDELPDPYAAGEPAPDTHTKLESLRELKQQVDKLAGIFGDCNVDNISADRMESLRAELDGFKLSNLTIKDIEGRYQSKIDALQREVQEARAKQIEQIDATTQANSGEYEIDGIVKSYQVQLGEQIALAKFDIMATLEEQLCTLAASNCDDDDWPAEFLAIRNKLAARHEKELARMQQRHADEVARLKQERTARRSLDFNNDDDPARERKTTNALRNLLVDTHKYFTQCEVELNATLFEELARVAANTTADSDSELNLDASTSSSSTSAQHRVHLTPNIGEFIEKVDNSDENVSADFRHELGACLSRLKSEANAILALTVRSADEKQPPPPQQQYVRTLETERQQLEAHLEEVLAKNRVIDAELQRARDKIGELVEYGRKEVVSEGYGESAPLGGGGSVPTRCIPLAELHERARQLLADDRGDPHALQVVGELCRECDRLGEDAKRDRQDLLLQIVSADKKLKATQKFLEEQAAEREQERDEAQKMLKQMRDQLKDREKDRAEYERVNEAALDATNAYCGHSDKAIMKRVEGFESQMREMSELIADGEKRYQEAHAEREEAIEKIGLLRDIIKDLELQVETKAKNETDLKVLIEKQREANDELLSQLDAASNATNFQAHILELEAQVSQLRRASDIVGNEGLIKQIQLQLHELELSVDKSIREIESLYATKSSTTCSTPSEEMSVQDQIRPKTPNSNADDCEVPLQQLARLKEKLLRHSRAENGALKRIQDLELQLLRSKQEHDDVLSDKNVLQEQVSEQLVLISSLQMRLDDARIRAEHVQKESILSLEVRIYDLESELQELREKLTSRESTLKQLTRTYEETRHRLKQRDEELSTALEEGEARELRAYVDRVRSENAMLRAKIEADAQSTHILPGLVDNIIADKNKDIDTLRHKLKDTERQFELYRSINSNRDDEMTRGVMSLMQNTSPEPLRHAVTSSSSMNLASFVPEISSIEKSGPPNVHYTMDAPLMKANSTEIQQKSTSEKRVHFAEECDRDAMQRIETLGEELASIKEQLHIEEEKAHALSTQLAEAQAHIAEREKELAAINDDVRRKDEMYVKLAKEKREVEKQFETLDAIRASVEELQINEEQLQVSLKATKAQCDEKQASYEKLASEFANYKELREAEMHIELQTMTRNADGLTRELRQRDEEQRALQAMIETNAREVTELAAALTRARKEQHELEERLADKPSELVLAMRHKKELGEKELQIVKLKSSVDTLKQEVGDLQELLVEKDKIVATMRTDGEMLRVNLETIKAKMAETGNVYELREKLRRELALNAQLMQADAGGAGSQLDDIGDRVREQLDVSEHLDERILQVLSSDEFNTCTDVERMRQSLATQRRTREHLEARVQELEAQCAGAEASVKEVLAALDEQRKVCERIQTEDTLMRDVMRKKLDEAHANELDYKGIVENERLLRRQLESELATWRRNEQSQSASSKTEYKPLANAHVQTEVAQWKANEAMLQRELKASKKARITAEAGLAYTKDVLNAKAEEIVGLQARIAESEVVVHQLQARAVDLEQKRAEVEQSRALIADLEREKRTLQERNDYLEKTKQYVPEEFCKRIRQLAQLIADHIDESRQKTDAILKLHDEYALVQRKLDFYEDRAAVEPPFDDPNARANYLFGKYLRSESYRNALSYQKKYLISLLATYQGAIGSGPLTKYEPRRNYPSAHGPLARFRTVVVVCMAIGRMKYMVRRWRVGTRAGTYLSHQRRAKKHGAGDATNAVMTTTHFQVGQPVSSEHFRLAAMQQFVSPRAADNGVQHVENPWSGTTPASRENAVPLRIRRTMENIGPLTEQLESYMQRMQLIQERLGVTLDQLQPPSSKT